MLPAACTKGEAQQHVQAASHKVLMAVNMQAVQDALALYGKTTSFVPFPFACTPPRRPAPAPSVGTCGQSYKVLVSFLRCMLMVFCPLRVVLSAL